MIAMSTPEPEGRRRGTPLEVAKTVLSAFFGVRRRTNHEAIKLTPVQVIIAGLIAAAVFVGSLVLLVTFILSRAGG